jgi:hypothetical protein
MKLVTTMSFINKRSTPQSRWAIGLAIVVITLLLYHPVPLGT